MSPGIYYLLDRSFWNTMRVGSVNNGIGLALFTYFGLCIMFMVTDVEKRKWFLRIKWMIEMIVLLILLLFILYYGLGLLTAVFKRHRLILFMLASLPLYYRGMRLSTVFVKMQETSTGEDDQAKAKE